MVAVTSAPQPVRGFVEGHTSLQVRPTPQDDVGDSGAHRQIVYKLRNGVRRGIPGKTDLRQLRGIELVVGEHSCLVIRATV